MPNTALAAMRSAIRNRRRPYIGSGYVSGAMGESLQHKARQRGKAEELGLPVRETTGEMEARQIRGEERGEERGMRREERAGEREEERFGRGVERADVVRGERMEDWRTRMGETEAGRGRLSEAAVGRKTEREGFAASLWDIYNDPNSDEEARRMAEGELRGIGQAIPTRRAAPRPTRTQELLGLTDEQVGRLGHVEGTLAEATRAPTVEPRPRGLAELAGLPEDVFQKGRERTGLVREAGRAAETEKPGLVQVARQKRAAGIAEFAGNTAPGLLDANEIQELAGMGGTELKAEIKMLKQLANDAAKDGNEALAESRRQLAEHIEDIKEHLAGE